MRIAALLFFLATACDGPSTAGTVSAPPVKTEEELVTVPNTAVEFTLIKLPGGTFKAGGDGEPDEGPVREATVRPFALGKHEVTWKEFDTFFESAEQTKVDGLTRPTKAKTFFGQVGCPEHFLESKKPLINVRWHGAMAYCDWLSGKTGRKFRLPTEVEWEYAARAGDAGKAPAALGDQAVHQDNSKEQTHPPGTRKPNAWGFHDMLGNVWEYALEPYKGEAWGPVLRGGAWNVSPDGLRYSDRQVVPQEWFEEDPNRPRSTWWLTGNFSQGMRVAQVGDAADVKASAEYAPKIEIKVTAAEEKIVRTGTASDFYTTVKGEVKNGGDRTIEELELVVYHLDPKGKPHLVDIQGADKPGRATYGWGYPVLFSSIREEVRTPLAPGGSRAFSIDIPKTFDPPEMVDETKAGARVGWIRFAPK